MDVPDVPATVVARVREIALALPETTEVVTPLGFDFRIRRRTFANVFGIADAGGQEFCMLVFRADPDEREALLAGGHPYFPTASSADRVGVVINDATDWSEMAELVTASYCINAPKKLAALVDGPPPVTPGRGR